MESEGVIILWGRLIECYNISYKWMVSNVDGKMFNFIDNIYGEIKVENLDCEGYVKKRMGKYLFNFKVRIKRNVLMVN